MCSLVSRQWNFPSSNICISPISHPTTKTQIFVSHPYPTTKIPKILLLLLSELRWWQKKDFQQKHYFEKTYQRAFEGTIKANFYDLIWAPHASVGHQHWPVFRQTCVTKCFPILSNIQKHTIFISVKISQFHPPTLKWGRKPVWVEIGSPQNWCHKLYHSPVLLPEPIAGQLLTEPCKTQPRDTHCPFEDKDKMPKRPNIQLPEYTILMLLILVTKIWVTSKKKTNLLQIVSSFNFSPPLGFSDVFQFLKVHSVLQGFLLKQFLGKISPALSCPLHPYLHILGLYRFSKQIDADADPLASFGLDWARCSWCRKLNSIRVQALSLSPRATRLQLVSEISFQRPGWAWKFLSPVQWYLHFLEGGRWQRYLALVFNVNL